MTIYRKLKAIALPIVRHFKADLTEHDRKLCAGLRTGEVAFWAPRECGTEWIWKDHHSDALDQETLRSLAFRLEWFDAVNRTYPGLQWHLVESTNGQHGHVCTVPTDYARDRLASRLEAFSRELNRAAA